MSSDQTIDEDSELLKILSSRITITIEEWYYSRLRAAINTQPSHLNMFEHRAQVLAKAGLGCDVFYVNDRVEMSIVDEERWLLHLIGGL